MPRLVPPEEDVAAVDESPAPSACCNCCQSLDLRHAGKWAAGLVCLLIVGVLLVLLHDHVINANKV